MSRLTIKENHWFFKLPPFRKFAAMTVNPNLIIFRGKIELHVLAHEMVHVQQMKKECCTLIYYIKYFYYWFINLFKYGFSIEAYFQIPYEKEAYEKEHNNLQEINRFLT